MNQSFAVWILIGLSLVTANLPFVLERPFLVLPWLQKGESVAASWMQHLFSLIFFGLLAGLSYLAFTVISTAFVSASSAISILGFLAKVTGVVGVLALLLFYPGWRSRSTAIHKSFFERMLEMLVFYALVGGLGFALELNMGNRFAQTWEFYAITLSLFVVLGYPGFVYRYLLRQRKR